MNELEYKLEHSIVSRCQTNCQWQAFDYSARIVLVISVVHHRFANPGWRISDDVEVSIKTHGMKEETYFYICKRFFAYVDDTTKIQFTVYSLLGDPFLSSAGEK
jgi:prophage tail gpP-like protein